MTLSHVLLGVATGVPVMIVVGPVSLLLIEQGMKRGFRGGMPAALGVGVTDLTFSVAAAVTGAAAARILGPAEAALHLVAFGVLGCLAAITWRGARRDLAFERARAVHLQRAAVAAPSDSTVFARTGAEVPDPGIHPTGTSGTPRRASGAGGRESRDGWIGRAGTFFAVTAANPVTILVFASLVVSGRDGIGSPGWVLGMTLASVLVSCIYLAVGHGLGAVLTETATARLRMGGAVVILALGVWFALV